MKGYCDGWIVGLVIVFALFTLTFISTTLLNGFSPLRCVDANSSKYYSDVEQQTIQNLNQKIAYLEKQKSDLEKSQPTNWGFLSVMFIIVIGLFIWTWSDRKKEELKLRGEEHRLHEKEIELQSKSRGKSKRQ